MKVGVTSINTLSKIEILSINQFLKLFINQSILNDTSFEIVYQSILKIGLGVISISILSKIDIVFINQFFKLFINQFMQSILNDNSFLIVYKSIYVVYFT